MTWNEIVYGTGDFLESTFTYLPKLGNIPNFIFFLVILAALIYWVNELVKYHKEIKGTDKVE